MWRLAQLFAEAWAGIMRHCSGKLSLMSMSSNHYYFIYDNFGAKTLSIMTFVIMTFVIMTRGITVKKVTLGMIQNLSRVLQSSPKDLFNNAGRRHAECPLAECSYYECY